MPACAVPAGVVSPGREAVSVVSPGRESVTVMLSPRELGPDTRDATRAQNAVPAGQSPQGGARQARIRSTLHGAGPPTRPQPAARGCARRAGRSSDSRARPVGRLLTVASQAD